MTKRIPLFVWVGFILCVVLIFSDTKGCSVIGPSSPPVIVMLHEAQHGPLSPEAMGAARELRDAGRDVKIADDDEVTGLGQTPAWLKPALEQGRAIMGGASDEQQKDDALVLLSGERVVKAIKMPPTRPEILEAVK